MLKEKQKKKLNFLSLFLLCSILMNNLAVRSAIPPASLTALEEKVFGSSHPNLTEEERLQKLEESLFGSAQPKLDTSQRLEKIKKTLKVPSTEVSETFKKQLEKQNELDNQKAAEQELQQNRNTTQTKAKTLIPLATLADLSEISDQMLKVINQERSFRSLAPLNMDPIAQKAANEHASYLIQTKQFSHFGNGGSNPDLRYTAAGGTGKLEEIVDGFFAKVDNKGQIQPINASPETANFLMDAILKVPDKADIVFANGANKAGISFVMDKDKKQLVAVINTVLDTGNISSIPNTLNISDYANANGSLSRGYKFAWLGVSKREPETVNRSEIEPSPYFAPIDQVIYMDKDSQRMKNIAKTIGVIGAMVAAPFTYGASMLVADILMQSVAQTYQAQDVAVRGGIRASESSFNGQIPMGEWGPGIYYLTVWAFNGKDKKPIIVSRRAVNVN